jgi:nitrogen regulatory protein P-II 1
MKKIEAIIRPATLDTVVEALVRVGVTGMTLAQVRGSGRQRGHCELYRGPDYAVDLLPKVKIEVLVPDEQAEEIVGMIRAAAGTNRIGDGKIFVRSVDEVVRIRTGEHGKLAV